jgi:hypothetical protein
VSLRPEFVAGFTAAEGTFVAHSGGRRCAFTIALGAIDADLAHRIAKFFGIGRVYRYSRRRPLHDDVVIFTVQSKRELVEVVVPFMDLHLPPSHKRTQYESWRTTLLANYSPAAAGSSATSSAQSTGEASDQRRSRS